MNMCTQRSMIRSSRRPCPRGTGKAPAFRQSPVVRSRRFPIKSKRPGSPTASSARRWFAPLLGLLLACPAVAADLQVYPIRIMLDPENSTATLTVSNRGKDDALLQLSVDAWSQVDGEEKLDPT